MHGCVAGGEEYSPYSGVNFSLKKVYFSCSSVSETVVNNFYSSGHISFMPVSALI